MTIIEILKNIEKEVKRIDELKGTINIPMKFHVDKIKELLKITSAELIHIVDDLDNTYFDMANIEKLCDGKFPNNDIHDCAKAIDSISARIHSYESEEETEDTTEKGE